MHSECIKLTNQLTTNEQRTMNNQVYGIKCNICFNILPSHSMARHLDINDPIHICPHAIEPDCPPPAEPDIEDEYQGDGYMEYDDRGFKTYFDVVEQDWVACEKYATPRFLGVLHSRPDFEGFDEGADDDSDSECSGDEEDDDEEDDDEEDDDDIETEMQERFIIPNWYEPYHFTQSKNWDEHTLKRFKEFMADKLCSYDPFKNIIEEYMDEFMTASASSSK